MVLRRRPLKVLFYGLPENSCLATGSASFLPRLFYGHGQMASRKWGQSQGGTITATEGSRSRLLHCLATCTAHARRFIASDYWFLPHCRWGKPVNTRANRKSNSHWDTEASSTVKSLRICHRTESAVVSKNCLLPLPMLQPATSPAGSLAGITTHKPRWLILIFATYMFSDT